MLSEIYATPFKHLLFLFQKYFYIIIYKVMLGVIQGLTLVINSNWYQEIYDEGFKDIIVSLDASTQERLKKETKVDLQLTPIQMAFK